MDDGSSVENVNKIKYRRRLDRTPDKQFEHLPYTDKVAVSSLRKALEEAKFRIIKLRDENDEKECIIDEEKMLRKAAEDKLQKLLVDLYNSPEVNIELQNRLPKAKKYKSRELVSENEATPNETHVKLNYGHKVNTGLSDHLIHIADEEFPPVHDKLSVNHQAARNDGTQRFQWSSESLSPQIIPGMSLPQTLSSVSASSFSSMESSLYQALPSYGGTVSDAKNYKDSSSQYELSSLTITKDLPATMMPVPNGNENRAVHWNLNPQLHGWPSTSHHLPPLSLANTEPAWNSQVTSQFQNHVDPSGGNFTINQSHNPVAMASRYEPLVNKYTDSVMPNPGQLSYNPVALPSSKQYPLVTPSVSQDNASMSNGTLVNPKNISSFQLNHPAETTSYPPLNFGTPYPDDGFSVSPYSTSPRPNPSYIPDSSSAFHVPPLPAHLTSSQSFKRYPSESVQVSHMTRLLAEISTLKKENNELREELKKVKQELEMLSKESKTDNNDNFETVGALIESVRAEEKKHNEAAKLLVQAADEDKLAALKKLDEIKLSNKLRRTLSESDLSEADTFVSARSEPKRRLSQSSDSSQVPLERLVRRQREIMKEEMQRVIDQRNKARQKVTKLEKKLSNLKMTKSSESKNDLLMARLKVMEEERDLLLAKFQFIMQDIGETKLVYNLHKALLSDDPANDMNTYHSSRESPADNNVINNKVKARESEDRSNLETKLAILQKENLAQAECIEKLQQLIQRQRHKLNTLCAGPMLLE